MSPRHADDDGSGGHAERTLPFAGQLLALLTQPASGIHLLEHRASMTASQKLEAVAAECGSDIDDDAANLQLLVPVVAPASASSRAKCNAGIITRSQYAASDACFRNSRASAMISWGSAGERPLVKPLRQRQRLRIAQ